MVKNSLHYEDWLLKAKHDLKAAQGIFRYYKNPPTDTVCYHCHQVGEKSLKAFLVYKRVSFPKIHDLVTLLNLCLLKDKALKNLKESVNILNGYYVEVKYPADMPIEYSKEEARQAIKYAELVFKRICKKLKSED
ncbi:MAG: HEPN domain-containing protein [Candidatus Omnitrophica bacterium]|nr:HEPN domain-containing protein [Candidatus Omnitrophota bacterium]